jgi:hypothetical protein
VRSGNTIVEEEKLLAKINKNKLTLEVTSKLNSSGSGPSS